MAGNASQNASRLLLPEIGPDGLARESPVIAYTEKVIEEEQLQLRKYIDENYSKIRDVERELANLSMEMKLTSGPKKAALELMRKKIEAATERVRVAKLKEEEAKKIWEAAAKAVKDEEAAKQKLCEDLNNLVLESSNSQLSRLEELKRRLEALNPSRSSISSPNVASQKPAEASVGQDSSSAPTAPEATKGNSARGANTGIPDRGQNEHPSVDGEGKAKKKSSHHGKSKGLGAVPKGRGPGEPGWTGAGFDVDGRS